MKKILFLDIDGVLNSEQFFKRLTQPAQEDIDMLDPKAVLLLDRFLRENPCKVVLCSAWRKHHTPESITELFSRCGAKFIVEDSTPNCWFWGTETLDWARIEADTGVERKMSGPDPLHMKERGLEIEHWIRSNFKPEEFSELCVAILDDSTDMHTLLPRLVNTKWPTGFREKHLFALKEMLNTPLGDLLPVENLWFSQKF